MFEREIKNENERQSERERKVKEEKEESRDENEREHHQAGAAWVSLLIRLVFRSWSLIFFSISASVRVSRKGHH